MSRQQFIAEADLSDRNWQIIDIRVKIKLHSITRCAVGFVCTSTNMSTYEQLATQ